MKLVINLYSLWASNIPVIILSKLKGSKSKANSCTPAISAIIVCLLVLSSTLGNNARANEGPGKFIELLGQRAVEVLSNKSNSKFSEREAAFRELLVDGFHMPTISRFVIGRYWRTASEKQRSDYNAIFVDFLSRVYAMRFNSYNGEVFEVIQVIEENETQDTIVRTQIRRLQGAPITVDYRVRKISGNLKVVDVNVEGISMLHTHRVEFASVINREGVDGFLDMLRERIAAPVHDTVD